MSKHNPKFSYAKQRKHHTKESNQNKSKFPSDPKIFGPGLWFAIHFKAMRCTDKRSMTEFAEFMEDLSYNLPCEQCRSHCQNYIERHAIKDYNEVKDKNEEYIGMFMWSWNFHNGVNQRLKKPTIDWETAYNMYTETETNFCSSDCGSDSSDNEPIITVYNQPPPRENYELITKIPKRNKTTRKSSIISYSPTNINISYVPRPGKRTNRNAYSIHKNRK